MSYPTYLVHFNKNHDKRGQFTYGDGDGDGTVDDHKNQKKNKYQYVDGSLTPKGKQRWARQYVKDVKRAAKKGEDVNKVQTEIDSSKWIKNDVGKNIFSAAWLLQVANYGGIWFRKGNKVYNEQDIDRLLRTHSGDSVYSDMYNKGKAFSEKAITAPIWSTDPKITERAFEIFRAEYNRNPDFTIDSDEKRFDYCLDAAEDPNFIIEGDKK